MLCAGTDRLADVSQWAAADNRVVGPLFDHRRVVQRPATCGPAYPLHTTHGSVLSDALAAGRARLAAGRSARHVRPSRTRRSASLEAEPLPLRSDGL